MDTPRVAWILCLCSCYGNAALRSYLCVDNAIIYIGGSVHNQGPDKGMASIFACIAAPDSSEGRSVVPFLYLANTTVKRNGLDLVPDSTTKDASSLITAQSDIVLVPS
ncbi:hypothetical protein BOTBODRAFT_57167 [Botryobasidium botryosum FD-172 SS1]|uniref:Uncharacterized protein n=1 Tax=Botryobasidium botryosum (strain FD-172 SS1) TaxID=930990 RepID=A0A067M823_BOTB1|nr:hypothetical protein BOTBODRAFT_57167 [Botryobasidium botryosum FD-172 SS1]